METIKLDIPTGITQLIKHYEDCILNHKDKVSESVQNTASYRAFLRKNEDSKPELGVNHYLIITSIEKDNQSGHYEAYDISEIKDIDEVNHRAEDLFIYLKDVVNMCNHSFVVKLYEDDYQHWNFYGRKYG